MLAIAVIASAFWFSPKFKYLSTSEKLSIERLEKIQDSKILRRLIISQTKYDSEIYSDLSNALKDLSIAGIAIAVCLFFNSVYLHKSYKLLSNHSKEEAEQDGPPNDPQRGCFRGGQA